MTAVGVKQVAVGDRAPHGSAIGRTWLCLAPMDFIGFRPVEQLLWAASGDDGESVGIRAAWNADIDLLFRDHLLIDLNTKFLGGAVVGDDANAMDEMYANFAASGGSISVIKSTSSNVDLTGGSSGSSRGNF